ncbi:MAG: hypothetical protein O7E53_03035 [Alphaproteobacteria bacterium]|nr:hypothetical protein [Alphaproteobacteria bacterium]
MPNEKIMPPPTIIHVIRPTISPLGVIFPPLDHPLFDYSVKTATGMLTGYQTFETAHEIPVLDIRQQVCHPFMRGYHLLDTKPNRSKCKNP